MVLWRLHFLPARGNQKKTQPGCVCVLPPFLALGPLGTVHHDGPKLRVTLLLPGHCHVGKAQLLLVLWLGSRVIPVLAFLFHPETQGCLGFGIFPESSLGLAKGQLSCHH